MQFTQQQIESIGYALNLAYDDQEHWLWYCSPKINYGDEWPETARIKAEHYRNLQEIESKLLLDSPGDRWETLANTVLELAGIKENTEKQQVADGEGGGNNPPGAVISGEVIAG